MGKGECQFPPRWSGTTRGKIAGPVRRIEAIRRRPTSVWATNWDLVSPVQAFSVPLREPKTGAQEMDHFLRRDGPG